MNTAIIIAIIGAIPALITAIVSVYLNNRVINVELQALKQQFNRLEEKVDKHNNFMERIAILESADKTLFHSIDDIKQNIDKIESSVYATK